ncbi:MAG: hypothetical protein IPP15_23575 [Saprospiraceae bacterium]|uniref:Uncharacterized protein n=1 Tax=Candidatus Opimibacter skivensis TaxID=2982028 RepID=A0A9D7XQ58_9BACT|nr:hypothetical protein [Candidatus Opimibacter skivensis]
MLKSDKLDDFSKQFYTNLLQNRNGTLHPATIIDLSDKTLKADNVEVSRTAQKVEKLGEPFLQARTQDYLRFIQNKNDFKEIFCKEKRIPFHPAYRSERQAYHDITLRELVLDYRYASTKGESSPTFNQVKYFSVTLDDLLIQFDQHSRRSHYDEKAFPIFFKPSFLLNKLSKLLPIKTEDYKKAYFKAITSRGFNKDLRKSEDIQKIATYLKHKGIDNDEVIYNLISEDLFLEKYHKQSEDNSFNAGQFIEDELNRQYKAKLEELEKNKKELENVKTTALTVSSENNELNKKISDLSSQLHVYSVAADRLSKKVKKLEKQTAPKIVHQLGINFEAAEKQKELESVEAELKAQRELNNRLVNEKRKPKRDEFIRKKMLCWRLKSFIWIIVLPILFLLSYLVLKDSKFFPAVPPEGSLNVVMTTPPVSGILIIGTILYQAIFISIFSSKFFQTNKSKFIEQLDIPADLQDVKN